MTEPDANGAVIVWFHRDLRLSDHPALHAAAETGKPVIPVYILDDETPGDWKLGGASRWWLAQSLRSLAADLARLGSRLILRRGRADEVLPEIARETGAGALHFTRGYEPFQRALEDRLQTVTGEAGVACRRFAGHVIFEPDRLFNKAGEPFRVYSPFFRAASAQGASRRPLPAPGRLPPPQRWPRSDSLESWRLEPAKPDWAGGLRAAWTCGETAAHARLHNFLEGMLPRYAALRNEPGTDGTSRLSPHLAFGEISPNQIWHAVLAEAEKARKPTLGETYLKEIAWREFSYHLLFHFPHLPEEPFRPEFAGFPWTTNAARLAAWQKGRTGYPIVDAGMRQLWHTGWMHNRVRMITASFLIKHLLVHWKTGEEWFWDTLVDADLANNAASWQWVAGSGADAAPYFRIFNPFLQGEKFDPRGEYVRQWVPELARLPDAFVHRPWEAPELVLREAGIRLGETYPEPIVDHGKARERALAAFEAIKKAG